MNLDKYNFVKGVELKDNTLIFAVENSEFSTTPHTLILFRTPEGIWSQPGHLPWPPSAVSSNTDGTGLFSISPIGKVLDIKKDGHSNIHIYKEKQTKTEFRFSKSIDNVMYAGGTNRFLFKFSGLEWSEISNDEMKSTIGVKEPKCFENITGFNQQELYAFGWRGVIWTNKNGEWHKVISPTNRILNDGDVNDSTVYIGGQLGTIIKGRGDTWKLIKNDKFTDDIWSVCSYGDAIYFSTNSGIYQLKDDNLTLFKALDKEFRSSMHLFTGPSGLWSIGASDISLFDGEKWKSIAQSNR